MKLRNGDVSVNLRISAGIQKTVRVKGLYPDSGRRFAARSCSGKQRQNDRTVCKLAVLDVAAIEVRTIYKQEEE